MTKKREARFQAEQWTDDELYAIAAGIHASPTLTLAEKVKAVMMLEQVHRAMTGKAPIDPYLKMAAHVMGCVDLLNELVPNFAIPVNEALRLVSECFLAGKKSPEAIRSALRRTPYDQIRIDAFNDPRNRHGVIPGKVETSPAYQTVRNMLSVATMTEILTEGEADYESWTAAKKAADEKRVRDAWLKLARGGSKFK